MGRKNTLQSTTQRSMVVLAATRSRIVTKSLVPVLSYCIRSQSVEDLVLVSSASFEPSVEFVHHHSLDLG
jgi:hypothetical protein